MRYCALSFSHRKTPIELREKIAFNQEDSFAFAKKLKDYGAQEVLLVSTCNRTEFYFYVESIEEMITKTLKELAEIKKIDEEVLSANAEVYQEVEAIHHIFCVVSSLDSVVVGETQITGQFKSAYKIFFDAGLCNKALTRLMHFAFKCAAKVRNQTEISKNSISIASVATQQATRFQIQYNLPKKALVVGFGEMGRLNAKHLLTQGYEIMICNRDQEKIKKFILENPKEGNKISSCIFEDLQKMLNFYPFVFSATAADSCVISKEMVQEVEFKRFWFDLAVPRDIEHFRDEKIEIFVVDDLNQVVQNNLATKRENMHKAYQIVGIATMEFNQWLQNLDVEPLIKEIRELAKQASMKEIKRALKKGYIVPDQQYSVEKILHQAFNTFLHAPTQKLRDCANKQESDIILESIKSFFDIKGEGVLLNAYKCEYETPVK